MKLSSGLLGLTLSSVVALASANAADMYVPGSAGGYKDFGPIETWAGFYAGVNGGWAWGTQADVNASFDCGGCGDGGSRSAQGDGGFGGGQVGYNVQRDRLVFGLEADFQGANISGTAAGISGSTASAAAETDLDFFGTVRGRLGLTFPDAAGLIYITGGFAYGDLQHKLSVTGAGVTKSASDSRIEGGYTLGAGYERFVTPNISLKAEYQFIDLGTDNLHVHNSGPYFDAHASFVDSFNTVRAGLNYHVGGVYEPLK